MKRILIEGGTETSEVVMLADAIDFHILAIEEEALLGIKLHITEACGCGLGIHHLAIHQEFALDRIEIRIANAPKCWVLHLQGLHFSTLVLSHHLAGSIEDGIAYLILLG